MEETVDAMERWWTSRAQVITVSRFASGKSGKRCIRTTTIFTFLSLSFNINM